MGGGMALQLGYKYLRGVAGVFAMSSFLGTQSQVYEVIIWFVSQKPSAKHSFCHL